MTKVKVFVYGRRRRRQRQQRRRRRGYDNSSPDFRHGELKSITRNTYITNESPTSSRSKLMAKVKLKFSLNVTQGQ